VIPACAARLLSRTFTNYVLISAGLGALSAVVGMVMSAAFNLPSGPSIVATQLAFFLLALLIPQAKSLAH
jgi:zinc/manganese transport system permease protein